MKKRQSSIKKPSRRVLLSRLALVNGLALTLAFLSIRALQAIRHLLSSS